MKIRTQYECQEQYAAKGEPTDEELDATIEEQSSGFVSRLCHRCGGSLLVSAGLAQIGSQWECERPCVRVLIDDLVECEG